MNIRDELIIKMRKKSQIEMIGLTVIVIIVITGMLIATVYKVNKPAANPHKRYWNKELATNLLIAMTHTNVLECNNLTVRDLLQDCGSPFPRINCYDYTSCEVVNTTIRDIINKTLIEQQISFDLSISSPFYEAPLISINNFGCGQRFQEQEQAFELIRIDNSNIMEINLTICMD